MPIPWNGVVVIGHSFFSKLVFDIKDLFHALVASFLLLLLQGDNNITHVMCPTWLLTRSSGLWKHPAQVCHLPRYPRSKQASQLLLMSSAIPRGVGMLV